MTNNRDLDLMKYQGIHMCKNDAQVLYDLEKVVDLGNDGQIKYLPKYEQGSIVEKIRQDKYLDFRNGTNYFSVEDYKISILFLSIYYDEQLPESIGTLRGLKHLIFGSALRALPNALGNLENLKTLVLFGTSVKTLPNSICNLQNLTELMVSISDLTQLPDSIGNLINLETVVLNENKIKSLPVSIGMLKNLKILDLYNNKIKYLPQSIGKLENLNELDLGYNEIEFLPQSITNLSNLKILKLDKNNLRLPLFLEDLYKKTLINIKLDRESRNIHPRLLFSQLKSLRKETERIFNNSLDKIENINDFINEYLIGKEEVKKYLLKLGIRVDKYLKEQIKNISNEEDKLKLETLSKQIIEQDIKSNIKIQFIRPTEIEGSNVFPMGLLYLSSYLKNNLYPNIEYIEYLWINKKRRQIIGEAERKNIRILNDPELQRYNRIEREYEAFLKNRDPSLIFIGPISTVFLPFLIELVLKLRDLIPNAILFAGGYHFGINLENDRELLTKICPEIDGLIIGDAEDTILEIAETYYTYFRNNKKFPRKDNFLISIKNINGMLLKDNLFKERKSRDDLYNLPIPDYELLRNYFKTHLDQPAYKLSERRNPIIETITKKTKLTFVSIYNTYNITYFNEYLLFSNPPYGIIVGSRFCPYNCSFCASSVAVNQIRKTRPAKTIFEEMKSLYENYDFSFFVFFDPLFTTNTKEEVNRINELCDLILINHYDFRYTIEIRADVINGLPDFLMEKLIMSGCAEFNLGLEKGSNRALQRFQKNMTIEEHNNAILKIRNVSLKLKKKVLINGTFILGGPEENIQDIEDTLIHGFTLDLDGIKFFPLEIHPGTKIYNDAINSKILKPGLEPYLDENNYPIYETSSLSKESLFKIQQMTEELIKERNEIKQKLNQDHDTL